GDLATGALERQDVGRLGARGHSTEDRGHEQEAGDGGARQGVIQPCWTKNVLSVLAICSAVCCASPSTVCERSERMPPPVLVTATLAAAAPAAAPAPAMGPIPGLSELFTVV